ncbi:META domain-containing protein [Leucobacter musarum]|uniref:META domain-containing protein n=1 Tax=Leucobacter musarum TaxID=1930747 RepID=UPI0006A7E43E|nr:META domain-containing protein [Leucobacter musarum]
MSETIKHALGMLFAGVIAFGGVGAAVAFSPASATDSRHEASANEPATAATLVGRWQAPEPANQDAFVEFTQYGLWFASDGCNGLDGTWAIDDAGELEIHGSKAMTLMWCDNVDIPMTVAEAASAEIAGGRLTLTTETGDAMTLDHTRSDSVSLVGSWQPIDAVAGPQIDFTTDTELVATDGCNGAPGSWTLVPALEYGEPASAANLLPGRFNAGVQGYTQVGCAGNAERDYMRLFSEATHLAFIDADRVALVRSTGDAERDADTAVTLERVS